MFPLITNTRRARWLSAGKRASLPASSPEHSRTGRTHINVAPPAGWLGAACPAAPSSVSGGGGGKRAPGLQPISGRARRRRRPKSERDPCAEIAICWPASQRQSSLLIMERPSVCAKTKEDKRTARRRDAYTSRDETRRANHKTAASRAGWRPPRSGSAGARSESVGSWPAD